MICLETQQIFNSASDAARYIQGDSSSISKCCKGQLYTVKGYHWQYYDSQKIQELQNWRKKFSSHSHKKSVICIETNKIYPSAAEAERTNNIYHGSVSACCRREQKTAGGYHWKFYEEGGEE